MVCRAKGTRITEYTISQAVIFEGPGSKKYILQKNTAGKYADMNLIEINKLIIKVLSMNLNFTLKKHQWIVQLTTARS